MTDIATVPLTYNSYVLQMITMAVAGQPVYLGGTQVLATSMIPGTLYTIESAGTTNFTAYGAPSNSPGTTFTATGPATGSGTVLLNTLAASSEEYFNAIIPQMLNYAELRIQRDLDIQNLETVNSNYSINASSNLVNVDINDFVVVETVSVAVGSAKIPLTPVSKDYIHNVYNDSSYTGVPSVFCIYAGDASGMSNSILFGPYADNTYSLVLTGLSRARSLYYFANPTDASSQYTYISAFVPDLLIMASMVYISAYQRNFGIANDDPKMAVTYESQYQTLLNGAKSEEYRKKFEASAWTSYSNSPEATPSRG
jgi:hypothetical protein